mmetsp:Transcript_73647/g.238072  ORF Transcript_73647/g.238072 Transcript_73647/m.238072 type:complete len:288 (+) Transcript_73647:75-938(+)
MADTDNKIYVGGLAHETTKDALEAQFRQYGEIVDCVVMVDKATNRSRGFGFVTFKESTSANAALGTANNIDGREVSCKKAVRDSPKQIVQESSGGVYNTLKIFVGGLPSSCDYDKLTGYFGRFGQIQDAVVMMDQMTQRHRGFGYVTFSDSSAVEAALQMYPENKIDGKWIEVKRCIPQESMRCCGGGSSNKGKGSSKGYDAGRSSGGYAPHSRSGMYGDPYGDPYAATGWYGGTDPYGAYGAYGMAYPQPMHHAYGAYAMSAYPHAAYGTVGAYGSRYGGYRPGPY